MPTARKGYHAQRIRAELFAALGALCARCGSTDDLEFDCKHPAGHAHHKLSSYDRACWYRRLSASGGLQVLCRECNNAKGSLSWEEWCAIVDTNPF